jgi:hypothetical protein
VAAGMAVAACAGPPGPLSQEQVVFPVASGFSQSGPATTIDVDDIGLPLLHNLSSHSVRLRSVRIAGEPRAVHLDSVTAYKYGSGGGIALTRGNLLKGPCRRYMTPYPVGDVVTPPHADSNWYVIIALTITRPGRYDINRAQISYTTNGHRGWQYQNLSTTLEITAARPHAEPVPGEC